MLTIQQLQKSYGTKNVLTGVAAEFEPGKVYGIVGANGAGKTTLFRCIAGLENYEGQIISEHQPLKNHLGFLPTSPFFFEKITGREYLQLIVHARRLPKVDFKKWNVFKLPLDQYATTYSTGMQKKLAILGLLIQKNEVIILDEPFNGVDIQSNILLLEIIRQLKVQQKTILIASHIFSTLTDVCDEIILLEKGRFAQQVTPDQFADLDEKMRRFIVGDELRDLFHED